MANGVVEELAEIIGARLFQVGTAVTKGIIFQIAPEHAVKAGTLLHGTRAYPFVSISHIQPEQFAIGESTNVSAKKTRVFTVAMIGDKAIVEKAPGVYSAHRDKLMSAMHTYRGNGQLTSIPNACIMHATVRPSSPIQRSAWVDAAKFVSTFDVLFETEEPTGLI
jgi:hypothetical protein